MKNWLKAIGIVSLSALLFIGLIYGMILVPDLMTVLFVGSFFLYCIILVKFALDGMND
jgi:hypothetical protein